MNRPDARNPFLLFGCGNMGRAMLDGWLAAGVAPESFTVIDPFAVGLPVGVGHHADAKGVNIRFESALLAVKPQMFGEIASTLEKLLAPDALLISILAGTQIATLQQALPGRRIVRLMPNLAAAIGKSPLGLWEAGADAAMRSQLEDWLAPLGEPVWLSAESQMDAVTALAGSGPAFVYRFIDALAKGGVALDLEPEIAARLATTMVEGAAMLAAGSAETPAGLARRVTSPGGTTAAGLSVVDRDSALDSLIEATLRAARNRGAELAKASDNT